MRPPTDNRQPAAGRSPAGSRAAYIILLLLVVALVLLLGGDISYALLYLVLAAPLCSLGMALWVSSRIQMAEARPDKRVVRGVPAVFALRAQNRSHWCACPRLTANVTLDPSQMGDTATIAVAPIVFQGLYPQATETVRRTLNFPHRGVYRFGVSKACYGDMMGLFVLPFRYRTHPEWVVYPRLQHLKQFPLLDDLRPNRRALQGAEEVTELLDVRRYQPGDNVSRIHWKLSARKNELFAKQFEQIDDARVVLILDLTLLEDKDQEDILLESSLAVCDYLLRMKQTFRIVWVEESARRELEGSAGLHTLYETLARVVFDARVDLFTLYQEEFAFSRGRSAYLLFTAAEPERLRPLLGDAATGIVRAGASTGLPRGRAVGVEMLDGLVGALEGGE